MSEQITNPLMKASAAIGTSAGANIVAHAQSASSVVQNFWPVTAAEWGAFISTGIAIIYTAHLLSDFYWKKFWRGYFERRGWIKPRVRQERTRWDDEDETSPAPLP